MFIYSKLIKNGTEYEEPMADKKIFTKKYLPKYSNSLISVPLIIGTNLLAVTGYCTSPKVAYVPPPLSQTVTAPATALSEAFIAVAAYVRPAVVTIYSTKMVSYESQDFEFPFDNDFFQRFFGQNPNSRRIEPKEYKVRRNGLGSGMILDQSGCILTNNHVIKDVDEIKVRLADKREFKAEVVSNDSKTDVAIIRIKGELPKDLPYVQLGNSDLLRVGELVMAIGAPHDLTQTVTTGIISATGRADIGLIDYEDFLQTDAPINPGNSGGPLVNMRGEVVGMNTAMSSDSAGLGFAIPVNMIKNMLPTLIKGGKIARGMLGVTVQDLSKDLVKQFRLSNMNGVLVTTVQPDSTADKAGVKVGDVIISFNDKETNSGRELRNQVAAAAIGVKCKLNIIRAGQTMTLLSILEEANGKIDAFGINKSGQPNNLGITIQALTPTLAKQYHLTEQIGVLITDVDEGSLAAQAGLREGDLIIEVNRKHVTQLQEFRKYLSEAKRDDSLLLLIKRKDQSLFVALQVNE